MLVKYVRYDFVQGRIINAPFVHPSLAMKRIQQLE